MKRLLPVLMVFGVFLGGANSSVAQSGDAYLTGNQIRHLLSGSTIKAEGECGSVRNVSCNSKLHFNDDLRLELTSTRERGRPFHKFFATYETTGAWNIKENKICLTEDAGKDAFSIIFWNTKDRCFSVTTERFNFVFEDSQGNKVWDVNIKNARLPETTEEQYASLPPPEKTPENLNADANAQTNAGYLTGNQIRHLFRGSKVRADGSCGITRWGYSFLCENEILFHDGPRLKLNTLRITKIHKEVAGTYVTTGAWVVKKDKICLTEGEGGKVFDTIFEDTTDRCFSVTRERFNFVFEDSKGNKVWDVNIKNARLPETTEEQYASLPPPERTSDTLSGDAREELERLHKEIARLKEEKRQQPKPSQVVKKKPAPERVAKKVPEHPDAVAVIIANSNYKRLGKDIPNVDPAYNDAESIKKYFTQSLGVREGNIIYLKDATGAQLTEVFGNERNHKAQLFNWVKPNKSKVYVYYAGHGAPASQDGSAFLVPADAKSQTIEFSGYPIKNLYRNLGKIKALSVTLILEACFSGSSQSGGLLPRSSGIMVEPRMPKVPRNVKVISAGAADQMASWEKDESQSLFTKYFLLAMGGEGDKKPYGNGDGKVDDKELQKYLDDTMTYYARRYYGRDQRAQITTIN